MNSYLSKPLVDTSFLSDLDSLCDLFIIERPKMVFGLFFSLFAFVPVFIVLFADMSF